MSPSVTVSWENVARWLSSLGAQGSAEAVAGVPAQPAAAAAAPVVAARGAPTAVPARVDDSADAEEARLRALVRESLARARQSVTVPAATAAAAATAAGPRPLRASDEDMDVS